MKIKSLFSSILKLILLFASFTIVISALAFFIGEYSYGIKNEQIKGLCASIANNLAHGWMFAFSVILAVLYFMQEYKLRNKVSWKRVLLVAILSVISGLGLYSFGPFFIIAAFILILCIIILKNIGKKKNV